MPTAVSSSTSQESFRSQISQNRADKPLGSSSRGLQKSTDAGKTGGAEASSASKAAQRPSDREQTNASAKVSLSSAGVEKAAEAKAAERSERNPSASADKTLSYGAQRAVEQYAKSAAKA